MKKSIFIFLILFSIAGKGQMPQLPVYYLNGQIINMEKVFINPQRVDSFSIIKKTKNVFIFTKQKSFTTLTLNEILSKYTTFAIPNDSLLIRINKKVVADVSDIRIDDTFFIYVQTEPLSAVQYLNDKYTHLTIVHIDLESDARPFMIRGNQEIYSKSTN